MLEINQSAAAETALINLVARISKQSTTRKKDIAFYWSKKSPEIAAAIYNHFVDSNALIFDPFLGSGSSLSGLKLFPNRMKFIGVDVNQLPIELTKFNTADFKPGELNEIVSKIEKYISENEEIYKYYLGDDPEPYIFKKAILNREDGNQKPTQINFEQNSVKVNLTKEDGLLFEEAKNQYITKQTKIKNLNEKLPDLELNINSRIAIKAGMKLSDIFSPVNFNLLLKYKEIAIKDMKAAILLSSCLHLCRLTDTRSQSQFPFWIPKIDAVDRNIFDLLTKKIIEIKKIIKLENQTSFESHKSIMVENFIDLKNSNNAAHLLLNLPIQKIDSNTIEDESVDLVFTDPPYFDQVAYSEYLIIWEFFTGIKSNQEDEIVQSNRQIYNRDREKYLNMMSDAFSIISKKLKLNKHAVIYFKDSKLKNIADFLQIMEMANLEYLYQIHLPKSKFTYKQNTSQEGTVEGDSIYIFKKIPENASSEIKSNKYSDIDSIIVSLVDEYLEKFGSDTPSKILDNFVIPGLWKRKVLHLITEDNIYQELIKKHFRVDKESRKIIDRA